MVVGCVVWEGGEVGLQREESELLCNVDLASFCQVDRTELQIPSWSLSGSHRVLGLRIESVTSSKIPQSICRQYLYFLTLLCIHFAGELGVVQHQVAHRISNSSHCIVEVQAAGEDIFC